MVENLVRGLVRASGSQRSCRPSMSRRLATTKTADRAKHPGDPRPIKIHSALLAALGPTCPPRTSCDHDASTSPPTRI